MLRIDGAYGEGGGQVVRTALTLSAILSQPIRLDNIRANRKNPGLAAQHLTAVRAVATICDAEVSGADLGSTQLMFIPHSAPLAGFYEFDVAEAREGGSAGATTLVLQTILLPLALADETSEVTIKGGTHVAWSPSYHYIQDVYIPTLAQLGIRATVSLSAWGWYPAGEGEIQVKIMAQSKKRPALRPLLLKWSQRGPLQQIRGVAVASSLPSHIAQRMSDQATRLLDQANLPVTIEPQRVRSVSPGAGIFLVADYGNGSSLAGFSALGKKGKPAEQVAEEAVADVLTFHKSGAVLDKHLTDQLIAPLALLGPPLLISTEQLTQHTLTNLWVVEQFLGPIAQINQRNRTIHFTNQPKILP